MNRSMEKEREGLPWDYYKRGMDYYRIDKKKEKEKKRDGWMDSSLKKNKERDGLLKDYCCY